MFTLLWIRCGAWSLCVHLSCGTGPQTRVLYTCHAPCVHPVPARDFVTVARVVSNSDGSIHWAEASVEHPGAPAVGSACPCSRTPSPAPSHPASLLVCMCDLHATQCRWRLVRGLHLLFSHSRRYAPHACERVAPCPALATPFPPPANVRGDVVLAGWILEPHSDGSSCTATYITQLRYGTLLPTQIDVRAPTTGTIASATRLPSPCGSYCLGS